MQLQNIYLTLVYFLVTGVFQVKAQALAPTSWAWLGLTTPTKQTGLLHQQEKKDLIQCGYINTPK